jgi:hypothetical protein
VRQISFAGSGRLAKFQRARRLQKGVEFPASFNTEKGYPEGNYIPEGASIPEKLNLLSWFAYLAFIVGLIHDSMLEVAVRIGFPFFLVLSLWTIYVSYETKAAVKAKGWFLTTIIALGDLTFFVFWVVGFHQKNLF